MSDVDFVDATDEKFLRHMLEYSAFFSLNPKVSVAIDVVVNIAVLSSLYSRHSLVV